MAYLNLVFINFIIILTHSSKSQGEHGDDFLNFNY